jgi:hypothetical protein
MSEGPKQLKGSIIEGGESNGNLVHPQAVVAQLHEQLKKILVEEASGESVR